MKKCLLLICFLIITSSANAQIVGGLDQLTLDASDKFYGVDVSDTSLAATGTGKQFTLQALRNKDYDYVSVSTTITLSPNQFASITTSGTDLTITLPASPTAGQKQMVSYVSQTFGDVVTIGRNGETINGMAADIKMFVADTTVGKFDTLEFVYNGSTWIITKDALTPLGFEADLSTAVFTSNVANTTSTGVPFDSITNKFGNMWDAVNYKATVLRSGFYEINMVGTTDAQMTANLLFSAKISDSSTGVAIIVGDRISSQSFGSPSEIYSSVGSDTIWLDEGDEFEMNAFWGEANIGLKETSGFNGIGTRMRVREQR